MNAMMHRGEDTDKVVLDTEFVVYVKMYMR